MLWQDTRKMQHTPNMFFSYYLTSQAYLTDFIADKENFAKQLYNNKQELNSVQKEYIF